MAGMGEARKRGDLAMRVAAAKQRNAFIESQLPKLNPNVRQFHSRHGTQRLALAMMAAGVLNGK